MALPPTHSLWERLNTSVLLRFLLMVASGWVMVQLLTYFRILVVVFVCATILAFLLNHPVRWCRRLMPHSLAVTFVFLLALFLISGLSLTVTLAVLSQGEGLTASIAEFLNSLTPMVEQAEATLQQWHLQVDLRGIETQLKTQAVSLLGAGFGLLQSLLANFITTLLIAIVTFFMLLDGARIWDFVIKGLPAAHRQLLTETIRKNLLGFFWGRFLLALFVATSTLISFLLLKVPYALTLSVIIGLCDLIPGVGTTLGISLVGLLLLSQSAGLAVQGVFVCICFEQVAENLLLPRIMRNSLNINPVVIFFALIVGARVAGVLGVFLSIPVAGVLISLLEIEEMQSRSLSVKSEPKSEPESSQS